MQQFYEASTVINTILKARKLKKRNFRDLVNVTPVTKIWCSLILNEVWIASAKNKVLGVYTVHIQVQTRICDLDNLFNHSGLQSPYLQNKDDNETLNGFCGRLDTMTRTCDVFSLLPGVQQALSRHQGMLFQMPGRQWHLGRPQDWMRYFFHTYSQCETQDSMGML